MTKPPEADILLLRRECDSWTPEQFERLPDGFRESTAHHILIEFKATESFSKEALTQAAAYEYFYKRSQKLTDDEIQVFVICSIQPQKANREQYGYTIHQQPGVYQSDNIAFNHITLISLNELSDELHNAWITCVASKKLKRLQAFNILKSQGFKFISNSFKKFLILLWQRISTIGDDNMAINHLSPKEIEEMTKMWGRDTLLSAFGEYLADIPAEQRLAGIPPEQRLAGIPPEQRLAGVNPSDVLNYFKKAGLSTEEIETCLEQLKKQS